MKTIKEYFSPPKNNSDPTDSTQRLNGENNLNLISNGAITCDKVNSGKCTETECDKNGKQEGNGTCGSGVLNNIVNKVETPKKKRRYRKKVRKQPDPLVRGVADLLSTSLIIASPETSSNTQAENAVQKTENSPKTDTPQKVNVFQFMMDSRNKSIGQNSAGKEMTSKEASPDEELKKREKLATRKNLLKNWADSKGAVKRRLEEEDKDLIIDHKLKKRAKRLKKLLTNPPSESGVSPLKTNEIITEEPKAADLLNLTNEAEDEIILLSDEVAEKKQIIKMKMFTAQTRKLGLKKQSTPNGSVSPVARKKRKRKTNLPKPNDQPQPPLVEISKESSPECKRLLRPRKIKEKPDDDSLIFLPTSSESEPDSPKKVKKNKQNKPVKLAPVFSKALPKPKLDPEVAEARKQFLMSGIPSSLKKTIEKQTSLEEREFDVFPVVSHVQQKGSSEALWNLPKCDLELVEISPYKMNTTTVLCDGLMDEEVEIFENIVESTEKINKFKRIVKDIKSNNPNYPVYRWFRQIYYKNYDKTVNKTVVTKNGPGRPKKTKRKSSECQITIKENPEIKWKTWPEKYKPTESSAIIGNQTAVQSLKKWLQTWLDFTDAPKHKNHLNSSESEFDITDDSRESFKHPATTRILVGPPGSGKTSAVYAICNELELNVLELNASSKRTGKRLLAELQEATQSHQVKKNELGLKSFLTNKNQTDKDDTKSNKMCVLLVEDVDVVFEQDDGFIYALSQLAQSSKRPVVLSTTDGTSLHVQKFISQYKIIKFVPPASRSLTTWLQIVCLVEGSFVDPTSIEELLLKLKGDVRRTLLQLQFWLQSGGDISPCTYKLPEGNQEVEDVAGAGLSFLTEQTTEIYSELPVHSNWKSEAPRDNLRFNGRLGSLWWELPKMLDGSKCSSDKTTMDNLSQLYESIVLVDVMNSKLKNLYDEEPFPENAVVLKDSLELSDNMESYSENFEFANQLSHTLINNSLMKCQSESHKSTETFQLPIALDKSCRDRQRKCTERLRNGLGLNYVTDRKSLSLDFFPSLRNMARSEDKRATNNTKRGNRFRHYIKSLGVTQDDSFYQTICSILEDKNE